MFKTELESSKSKGQIMLPTIDERLRSAASLVSPGARLADIGSDHAYLPIYLCGKGIVSRALASDLNQGPVLAAKENIREYGMSDRIQTLRTDGLDGVFAFNPDHITILGMGGELIISIIDKAEWVKDRKIKLILQPMTHAELLYTYLLNNGFCVEDEIICSTSPERDDRIYRIIKASYDGKIRECGLREALVGRVNIEKYLARYDEITERYIRRIIRIYSARIEGKNRSAIVAESEIMLVGELENLLNRPKKT